jgi:1,4-dihydroxy-2-naphthoate octaprenyltransferase
MRRAMLAVFIAAFLSGLGLIHWGGPWMLAVGLASILCGAAYTGGPWPLGYHGLGDVLVFLFFGLVAVGVTYFVQAGRLSAHALLAGVPMGLLAANILLVNNYRDADTDAAAGKRTLVVRFGRGFARVQFAASVVVALAVPLVFRLTGYGNACLLPVLAAPLAWNHLQRLAPGRTPQQLVSLLGDTGKFIAIYAALFAAGILL